MKRKKLISLLLTALLLISSCIGIFAAEEDSKLVANLILSVKNQTGIDDTLYDFDTYYMNTYGGKNTYHLTWKGIEDDWRYISVNVTDTGVITSYHNSIEFSSPDKFFKYSKTDAKNTADGFISQLAADKLSYLSEPVITKSGSVYCLEYKRLYEGITVMNNGINIMIDGNSLVVENYNLNWSDALFTLPSYISADDAKDIYKEILGYDLYYTTADEDYSTKAALLYRPNFGGAFYIDAETGDIFDYDEELYYKTENAAMDTSSEKDSGGGLSRSELYIVSEIENMISQSDAEKTARSYSEFGINNNYKKNNSDIYKSSNGNYYISISFTSSYKEKSGYKHVSLDAKTGEFLNYSGYERSDRKETLTYEEGKEIAEKFLKNNFAEEFENVVFKEDLNKTAGYYEYLQTVDGIKVSNGGFSVNVSKNDKNITSASRRFAQVDFPSAENVQSIDALYEKVLNDENFKLKYVILPEKEGKGEEARLVYFPEKQASFDANTLEIISEYTLKPVSSEEKPVYTDIKGHYAEPYILKLLEEDIFLPNNEFRPNEQITNKDFTALCYMVFRGASPAPIDILYEGARKRGILISSEEEAEKPITRMEAIKIMLDIMGYKEFVKIEGIFNCPFKDVAEEDLGYAAVAAGVKLVSRESELLYPTTPLKRCDAMIMMYNYMAR